MRGRKKETKEQNQKQKTKKGKEDIVIKKNMQVLIKSKVKLVSAVGIRLLTSFWIHFLFSLTSWSQVGRTTLGNTTCISFPFL